ncbi:hypothetical protein [Waltera sp.]|uniref:hypothetical protein n=1 Tax=Waltera sp. TaxID=2815806 RepID=UPI0039A070A2
MISVNSYGKAEFFEDQQLTSTGDGFRRITRHYACMVQAQVFPRDTGNLQNESTFVDYSESSQGKVSIISSTPYARRLYFHPEYHFQKTENPNARGEWYEDWISRKKSEYCQKAYKQIYRRIAGL